MAPSNLEQLKTLTAEDVKPTEAHVSLARFLTEHGPIAVSPEQAWAFIMGHRVWQSSDERAAEKAALKESRSTESAERAKAREEAKAAKAAEKAQKEAEKAQRAAEREAAKAAKAAGDDSDIPTDGEATEAPKRRRPPAKAGEAVTGQSAGTI